MTIVKWKRPYTNGVVNSPEVFNSPFSGLFDFWGDNALSREFASFVPAVNVTEEESKYNLELSAPGFEKENFKVEIENGTLTISGEHKSTTETTEKKYSRKEFSFGSFQRKFTLPEGINEDAVEAKYENGILNISLLKMTEPKKVAKEVKIS